MVFCLLIILVKQFSKWAAPRDIIPHAHLLGKKRLVYRQGNGEGKSLLSIVLTFGFTHLDAMSPILQAMQF